MIPGSNTTPRSNMIPKLVNREGEVVREQSGPSLGLKFNIAAIEHQQVINKALRRQKKDGWRLLRVVAVSDVKLELYTEHWRLGISCLRVVRDRHGRWHAHEVRQRGCARKRI